MIFFYFQLLVVIQIELLSLVKVLVRQVLIFICCQRKVTLYSTRLYWRYVSQNENIIRLFDALRAYKTEAVRIQNHPCWWLEGIIYHGNVVDAASEIFNWKCLFPTPCRWPPMIVLIPFYYKISYTFSKSHFFIKTKAWWKIQRRYHEAQALNKSSLLVSSW